MELVAPGAVKKLLLNPIQLASRNSFGAGRVNGRKFGWGIVLWHPQVDGVARSLIR